MPTFATSLTHLFLGPPGKQRVRVSQSLLTLGIFVLFSLVQHLEVIFELIDPTESEHLTWFYLGGATLFYLVIRSGLNEKLPLEPSLTTPQMVFGLCALTWSYAITGPARGAVLSIMMLILLFGMFALRSGQARRLALLGFGLMGCSMAYNALLNPQRYDPHVELVHLIFAAIVTGGVWALATRFGALREHLSSQKAELHAALDQIQQLATRDVLTGLTNRRAMTEQLDRQAAEQERRGVPMCLAVFDLDYFKRVNDEFGHATGDEVLKTFAKLAQEEVRGGDILARWGGEEFLLMMPDTGSSLAWHCVERIHRAMAASPISAGNQTFFVTFSAGLAVCQSSDDVEAAIDRADKAMYQAKTAGRNRTALAD